MLLSHKTTIKISKTAYMHGHIDGAIEIDQLSETEHKEDYSILYAW